MALACRPKLIIADEPTTALDVTVQAQILALLKELTREADSALILITHDLGVVARYADRVAVMYAGRIVETASARDLYGSPRHPYTQGLMASIPGVEGSIGRRLQTIDGRPPISPDCRPGAPSRRVAGGRRPNVSLRCRPLKAVRRGRTARAVDSRAVGPDAGTLAREAGQSPDAGSLPREAAAEAHLAACIRL